jgi:hypothetical protein
MIIPHVSNRAAHFPRCHLLSKWPQQIDRQVRRIEFQFAQRNHHFAFDYFLNSPKGAMAAWLMSSQKFLVASKSVGQEAAFCR